MSRLESSYSLWQNLSLWISTIGAPVVLVCVGLVIALWKALIRSWRISAIWLSTAGVSIIAVQLIKSFISRPRPSDALLILTDPSFPSGHALMSAAFFTILGYFWLRKNSSKKKRISIIIICVAAPLFVGLSRLVLNVHWATDVLAGWIIGISIAIVAIFVFKSKSKISTPQSL